MWALTYKKPAVRAIGKLAPPVKKRMGAKLDWFASQPDPLKFAKALTQPADASYRFRVGDYRVLFDLEGDQIVVLLVQHRRDVYRRK